MKKTIAPLLLMFTTLTLNFTATANSNTTVTDELSTHIYEYGIYTLTPSEKIEEENAATGYRSVPSKVEFAQKTNIVPAKMGTSFGAKFAILGDEVGAPVTVRVVTRYPEPGVTNPETDKVFLTDEYSLEANVGDGFLHAYRLSNEWEVLEGTWIIELHHDGRLIGTKTFEVVAQ